MNGPLPWADPGFPREGDANSRGGGPPTYEFAKIFQKLHEIERIWTPGRREGRAPLDPPLLTMFFTRCK